MQCEQRAAPPCMCGERGELTSLVVVGLSSTLIISAFVALLNFIIVTLVATSASVIFFPPSFPANNSNCPMLYSTSSTWFFNIRSPPSATNSLSVLAQLAKTSLATFSLPPSLTPTRLL